MDEKQASKYEFDFDDEDDDFLLITIDGIYKQIYIGRDIPINYNNCSLSVQPLVEEIKEDMQYYLEWIYFARFISYRLYVIDYMIIYKYLVWKFQFEFLKNHSEDGKMCLLYSSINEFQNKRILKNKLCI